MYSLLCASYQKNQLLLEPRRARRALGSPLSSPAPAAASAFRLLSFGFGFGFDVLFFVLFLPLFAAVFAFEEAGSDAASLDCDAPTGPSFARHHGQTKLSSSFFAPSGVSSPSAPGKQVG